MLQAPITETEIIMALSGIAGDKAPGPDGYTATFFRKSWDTVGHTITSAVMEFFETGRLLKQTNHTALTLVPKSKHAAKVSDYRPIACCNVVYKLCSKIIASRLGLVMDTIIDEAQAAFVKGRNMVDNIHLMQELLRHYNKKRTTPSCTIKIDLRKAFDSISWTFLRQVLQGLGFPDIMLEWIMECVSTPSYSLMINGSLCGFFKGAKGLRQGDPLSPYLFVICLEYLSRLIRTRTGTGSNFNFHPKCEKLRITHLAFADDLMLLSRGDPMSVQILMDCMNDFGARSGLHLNVLKSNIYMAGVKPNESNTILCDSQLIVGEMPFRYLGIPLTATRLPAKHYKPLVDKLESYVNSWSAATLTFAGRLELIRSVMQGVECFWLGIFPLPAVVRSKIVKICRQFLWGSNSGKVAWAQVCLPLDEGGLGIRDIKAWNKALLARTLWNMQAKKDTLWYKWLHSIYLKGNSIWRWHIHPRDSPLLKYLHATRKQLSRRLGSRHQAKCMLAKWGSEQRTAGVKGPYEFFRNKGTTVPWKSVVWGGCNTPKHSFILWLSTLGRLKTRNRIQRFMDTDTKCPMCGNCDETAQHLFFQCSFSNAIWTEIKNWMGLKRHMTTLKSALKWIKKGSAGTSWQSKGKKAALAATVYHIWAARNRKIFENEVPYIDCIIRKIKTHVYTSIYARYPHVLADLEKRALGEC